MRALLSLLPWGGSLFMKIRDNVLGRRLYSF